MNDVRAWLPMMLLPPLRRENLLDQDEYPYTSFLEQLVSTGGIMILCTLVGADDADTRAHATGALAAVLKSTRAVDAALATLVGNDGIVETTAQRWRRDSSHCRGRRMWIVHFPIATVGG